MGLRGFTDSLFKNVKLLSDWDECHHKFARFCRRLFEPFSCWVDWVLIGLESRTLDGGKTKPATPPLQSVGLETGCWIAPSTSLKKSQPDQGYQLAWKQPANCLPRYQCLMGWWGRPGSTPGKVGLARQGSAACKWWVGKVTSAVPA